MAIAQENKRQRFEDEEEDPASSSVPEIIPDNSELNLPPLEPMARSDEEKTPPQIVSEALEERPAEAVLDSDTRFGPIVIPKEDTLWDYKYILSEGKGTCNIQFSAKNYPGFDAVIVQECGLDAGGTPVHAGFKGDHRKHHYYAPLRRNLAILRNYLMVTYPPRAEGRKNAELLKYIASRLGEVLRGEAHRPGLMERIRLFIDAVLGKPAPEAKFNRFLELANTPDRGIAFMYHYISRLLAKPSVLESLTATAQLPKDWKMLPLERTPFSSKNMQLYSDAARMAKIADAFEEVVKHLRSVDDMTTKDREISVEHARDILRNMRIIANGAREEKSYDVLDPREREAHSMLQAALCFQGCLADVARNDPSLLDDPTMIDSVEVVASVSRRVRAEEKVMSREEHRAPEQDKQQGSGAGAGQSKSKSKSSSASAKPKKENIAKTLHKFEEGINRVGELRKKSHVAGLKRKAAMAEALGKDHSIKAVREGQSTMHAATIHQVSVNDPELIQSAKKVNEHQAAEQAKENTGEQSIGGGARR